MYVKKFIRMKSVVRWLVDVSFRPPRHSYDPDRTVSVVTNNQIVYVRKAYEFKNQRGNKLYGSLWTDRAARMPDNCLLYLHSLGTNQFEALNLVPFMTSQDLALFSFDFPGCGISEGDHIPLDGSGIHDVLAACDFLDSQFHFKKYAVWGRSMGAAIALHSVSASNRFTCCVSDSAFQNTESVVFDQADQNGIPRFAITLIEPIIKYQANKMLKTNIIAPYPLSEVPYSTTPLLMGHGRQDTFVSPSQAQHLFDCYGFADKQLYLFDARHNSVRPYQWYETASRFIYRKLGIKPVKRFYDAIFTGSELHSGIQEVILADIDRELEQSLQKLVNIAEEEPPVSPPAAPPTAITTEELKKDNNNNDTSSNATIEEKKPE